MDEDFERERFGLIPYKRLSGNPRFLLQLLKMHQTKRVWGEKTLSREEAEDLPTRI